MDGAVTSKLRTEITLLDQHHAEGRAASTAGIVAAFATIYIIWGSTYLAIRVAVETLPPLLMAGARFLVAGAVLYTWSRWTGAPAPRRAHWVYAAIIGALLLLGGNGAVCWAERVVPSGIASLLVSAVPFWMVLLNWLAFVRVRPGWREVCGVLLGFVGMIVLINPGTSTGAVAASEPVSVVGAAVLLAGTLSWAVGSLYSRQARLPASPLLATAMEMLAGGAALALAGLATGEWSDVHPGRFSPRSLVALAYLTVFGSLIAFSAYVWLLRVSTPARVATYAYVNPCVAVLLGWAVLDEQLGARTFAAMAIIISAVVLITHRKATAAALSDETAAPDGEAAPIVPAPEPAAERCT